MHGATAPKPTEPRHEPSASNLDLWAAAVLAIVAAVAALRLPEGNALRIVAALPVLLVVPGYALIEALRVRTSAGRERWRHVLIGLGITPALVGLAALSTAAVDGGFRAGNIVGAVTGFTLVAVAVALVRRAIAASTPEWKRQDGGPPRETKPVGPVRAASPTSPSTVLRR